MKDWIEKAIEARNVGALENALEVHHYSASLDGEPDMRTLDHIGAKPRRLSSDELARVHDAIERIEKAENTIEVTLFRDLDAHDRGKSADLYPADEWDWHERMFLFYTEDCFDPPLYVVPADSFEEAQEAFIEWMPGPLRHYLVDPEDDDYTDDLARAERGECTRLRWTEKGWLDTERICGRELEPKDVTGLPEMSRDATTDPRAIIELFLEQYGEGGEKADEWCVIDRSRHHPEGRNPVAYHETKSNRWHVLDVEDGVRWEVHDVPVEDKFEPEIRFVRIDD